MNAVRTHSLALPSHSQHAAAQQLLPSVLAVKVDVEGSEWDVLHGMHSLLSQQQIELMSFEYGTGWNRLFSENRPVAPHEARKENHRTLHRFQSKMSAYGYDSYLIHGGTRNTSNGVVLVPCHGQFWHDDLELCFDRQRTYGSYDLHCWTDLLVVRRCNACLKRVLHDEILEATRGHFRGALPPHYRRPFSPNCPNHLL